MTNSVRHYAKLIFLFAAGILIGIAAVFIFLFFTPSSACNPPLPKEELSIGATVLNVEIATTNTEQACGLSGRTSLADNEGMLFPFSTGGVQSFWMKGMNFPLDMIWIGGGKVLGFSEDALPQPGVPLSSLKIYTSPDGTDTVLEVNAGTVKEDNIKVGNSVTSF